VNIVLRKTGKKFNREWIFRNVDLSMESGEKVVLLGPNGSGKSTFLQLLSGYVTPTEGSLQWISQGVELAADSVFQSVAMATPYLELPEELSFDELLDFHFRFKAPISGISMEEIRQLSGLPTGIQKPVRNFSSGMKQRVRLLLALCSTADLILLDEPCSNLDHEAVKWYHALADRFLTDRTVLVCSNRQENEFVFCRRQLEIQTWKN